MAQEATYEYPSPIMAGASRAAVQSELARAKLDGSCFAGGEQSTAGDASYDPRSNGTAGASRVAAGAAPMRVEIVAASEQTHADAFPGGGHAGHAAAGPQ